MSRSKSCNKDQNYFITTAYSLCTEISPGGGDGSHYQNDHYNQPHTEVVPGGLDGGQAKSLPLRPHRPRHGQSGGTGVYAFLNPMCYAHSLMKVLAEREVYSSEFWVQAFALLCRRDLTGIGATELWSRRRSRLVNR